MVRPFSEKLFHLVSVSIVGPNYIRINQGYLCSYRQQQIHLEREFSTMMTKVICYLVEHCHVPRSSPIIQEFSNRIKHCLKRLIYFMSL